MKNMYTPAYPSFAMKKWGLRGYTLHGHVFVMVPVAEWLRAMISHYRT